MSRMPDPPRPTDAELEELRRKLDRAEAAESPEHRAKRLELRVAQLEGKLEEMTRCRDSALRQLNREDDKAPVDLDELIFQGIDAVIGDWEGDVPLQRVVDSIRVALHPTLVKLAAQAEAGIALEEAGRKVFRGHEAELAADRDRHKKLLDDVVNEVFTITSAYSLPEDRDEASNAHLYALGRSAALQDVHYAVLRGLGCFEPNHGEYEVVRREVLGDLMRIAAYVSRGRSMVGVGVYPDALARRTLGAFSDEELSAVADEEDGT